MVKCPRPMNMERARRGTEGAEQPGKGGRPKKGIAQLFDIALTMRAGRALTGNAKSQREEHSRNRKVVRS